MRAVFLGAACLCLVAIGLLGLGLSLIPTDIGLTHLLGAYVFGASGGLAFVVAFAGRAIIRRVPSEAVALPELPAVLSTLPETEQATPSRPEPLPAPKKYEQSVPRAPSALATGLAAGAAGLAAGAALGGFRRQEPAEPEPAAAELSSSEQTSGASRTDDRFLDELERDLFAEIKRPPSVGVPPPSLPAVGNAVLGNEPSQDAGAAAAPENAFSDRIAQWDAGAAKHAEPSDTPMEEELSHAAPVAEVPSDADADTHAQAGSADLSDQQGADPLNADDAEPEPQPEVTPRAVPGLIADADSAALDAANVALEPLDKLEIVGAYDSGGTRFTMYSDGSVTAVGENVDRRFPSLDALRAFIDGGMKG
ncbi:hypothetical protein MCEMSEM23_00711 [Rhabdaerophilaceae bacterium]